MCINNTFQQLRTDIPASLVEIIVPPSPPVWDGIAASSGVCYPPRFAGRWIAKRGGKLIEERRWFCLNRLIMPSISVPPPLLLVNCSFSFPKNLAMHVITVLQKVPIFFFPGNDDYFRPVTNLFLFFFSRLPATRLIHERVRTASHRRDSYLNLSIHLKSNLGPWCDKILKSRS